MSGIGVSRQAAFDATLHRSASDQSGCNRPNQADSVDGDVEDYLKPARNTSACFLANVSQLTAFLPVRPSKLSNI
jgi:hypothetical protein